MSAATATDSSEAAVRYPRFEYRDLGRFVPRDTIKETSKAFFLSSGAGVFVAAMKASFKPPQGGISSFVALSHNVWLYGGVGTAFTLTECVTSNLMERESAWSKFAGGFAAGGVIGSTFRSTSKVIGCGLVIGSALGLLDWSGGFKGYMPEQTHQQGSGEVQELEKGDRQGFWDVVHRRPLSQTLDELGDLAKPFK